MRRPSHQIQEGSTPENHAQVMRNVSRFYIELRQVQNTYSLSQTALSPLLRVMLDDSKVHGLKLALRPCGRPLPLFLLGFLSSPSVSSFPFLCLLPFRLTHWLEEHSKDHASANPPRAPGWRQTVPWMTPGETVDMCGTCSVG